MYWIEQQKRRRLLLNVIQAKISRIARFIAAGGDPSSSPHYKPDYDFLVGEFGEGIFESEVYRLRLMKESQDKEST